MSNTSFYNWNVSTEEIESLKKEIQNTLNRNPYKLSDEEILSDGHFSNGHYIHSNQYYFAKYYFQSIENCKKLAVVFVDKLLKLNLVNLELKKVTCTLVGLRNYTGLLLSEVQSLLKSIGFDLNYLLIDQLEGNKFTWQNIPNFEKLDDRFLIVLPITCSCSTYIRVRKFLQNELRYVQKTSKRRLWVEDNFINIFLIKDNFFLNQNGIFYVDADYVNPPEEIYTKLDSRLSKLYSKFNWEYIGPDFIKFHNQQANSSYIAHPLINLFSHLSPVESCQYCFPKNGNISAEKKIFHTHINSETPNLLLELPKFAYTPELKHLYSKHSQHLLEFQKNKLTDLFDSPEYAEQILLFDNYLINGRYYSNYIRTNPFYTKNEIDILNFFTDVLEEILSATNAGNLVFITPSSNHNSKFLDEFVNYKRNENDVYTIFENEKRKCSVSILRYDNNKEFVDNFMASHRRLLENRNRSTLIIFFEEVLSIGTTFKLLNDYIKHYNRNSEIEEDNHGFDYVFSLVDRTTLNVRNEILRKIKSNRNSHPEKNLISFFHLHVPIIAAANLGNPIIEKLGELNKMIEESHLDVLKGYLISRLIAKSSKELPEEKSLYKINDKVELKYFPFDNSDKAKFEIAFKSYKDFFTYSKSNLLRLFISHEINIFLSQTESIYKTNFINRIIDHICNKICDVKSFFFKDEDSSNRFLDFERRIVHDNIIRTLSHYPYTYYNQIYNEVFNYCLFQMKIISGDIIKFGIINFDDFRNFKFYIRRLIELDSSFLISETIFKVLKRIYDLDYSDENSIATNRKKYFSEIRAIHYDLNNAIPRLTPKQVELSNANLVNASYKYNQNIQFLHFILFCYKESVFKNHYRSIKLEELLSSNDLIPTLSKSNLDDNNQLVKLIQDPYYILTSVIKTENIFLLSKLKELHKNQLDLFTKRDLNDHRSLNEKILDYYFKSWKSDPIILNAREFVSKAKHSNNLEDSNRHIEQAIANMLESVTLLSKKESRNEFSKTIKGILDSVVKIIEPGIIESSNHSKGKLGYALCIRYLNNSEETNDTDNIYIISSDKSNHDDILDSEGLIYQFMDGIYDISEMNVQTKNQKYLSQDQIPLHIGEQSLLIAVKSGEEYKSFQDVYFAKNYTDKSQKIKFDESFKKDIKENANSKGLSVIKDSNLTLLFRLSNFDQTKLPIGKHEIVGKAVLIITNTNEPNIRNYSNFMNYEKVRLLMLIKEELLEYLQEITESKTFWETLVNTERIKYVSLMKHGILTYFDSLRHILKDKEVNKETFTKNDVVLIELLHKILETQFKNLSYNISKQNNQSNPSNDKHKTTLDNTIETFSGNDLRDLFKAILELPEITSFTIKGGGYDLNISVPDFQCPRAIYYHVFPELFINIRKQTFLIKGRKKYTMTYQNNELVIENNYDPKVTPNPKETKSNGGREMCETICEYFHMKCYPIINTDSLTYQTKIMFKPNEKVDTIN